MTINKDLNLASLLKFAVVLVTVTVAFVWLQSDVKMIKSEQRRIEVRQQDLRAEIRQNYVNKEQLEYIVIQRLDRMENMIEFKFEDLKKSLDERDISRREIPTQRTTPDQ